jgi:hypothetical protein
MVWYEWWDVLCLFIAILWMVWFFLDNIHAHCFGYGGVRLLPWMKRR